MSTEWPEYEPTWKAIEARVTGAQPAPSFADAYQGAMEEVAIWKRRALEAEDLNRKFIAEINGPMHMGEPNQESYLGRHLRSFDELMVHLAADLKQAHGDELHKGLELWLKMFEILRS